MTAALLDQLTLEEKIQLTAGADLWRTFAIPRLSIPYIKLTDGPNGARGGGDFNDSHPSALFPSPSCLGATWDTDLAYAMGKGIAQDGIEKQCHVILGPTMNIQRDPRAGRYFESYSEDPILTGDLAASWVRGCQSEGAAATMKHFAGNESETDRRNVSSNISVQALREVYLEPFRRAMKGVADTADEGSSSQSIPGDISNASPFKGQPACVMTAYNRLNSISSSENTFLMQDVLRKEWGFDGAIISDWLALHAHGLKVTDLEMPGPPQHRGLDQVMNAIESGEITEADIDARVVKVLELIDKVAPLGYRKSPDEEEEASVDTAKVSQTIRRIAAEGAVLLKNDDNLLPIQPKSGLKIACIGKAWIEVKAVQIGGGSAHLTPQKATPPLDCLRTALKEAGVKITHAAGCDIHDPPPVLKADVQIDFHEGRTLGEGKKVGSSTLTQAQLDPIGQRPPGLKPNNFWLHISFDVTAEQDGQHCLGPTCLGSMQLSTNRGEQWDYEGEKDMFEYFLNPSKLWKPLKIDMHKGEKIRLTMKYLPTFLPAKLQSTLASAFKCGFEPEEDQEQSVAEAGEVAAQADLAIVLTATGKDWESEGYDREHIRLPRSQDKMVKAVHTRQPNTIVLNISGGVVQMPWRDQIKALVQFWFGGQETGEAVVDIILGRGRAPASGRMPNTWPLEIGHHSSGRDPSHFPGVTRADGLNVDYVEDRLVGYKHYNAQSSPNNNPHPAFFFGQGMGGYTTILAALTSVEGSCNAAKEHFTVQVALSNIGNRSGKYVVQIYVRPEGKSEGRPLQKLAAFKAVHLEAGQRTEVSLNLHGDSFSEWDESSNCWNVAAGKFTIVLASSADLKPESTLASHDVQISTGWTWSGIGPW